MKNTILYDNVTSLPGIHGHFKRQRIHELLSDAVNHPLVTVTAGAGFGKTQAMSAFLNDANIVSIWLQLSQLDNFTIRFWESFINAIASKKPEFSSQIFIAGFPHSPALFNNFLHKFAEIINTDKIVLVFDDFHLITEPAVIHFIENLLCARLKNLSVVLISRTKPNLDLQGLFTGDVLCQITEDDLRFTPEETAGYFRGQSIDLSQNTFNEIYSDTEGWISAIYLVGLSFKKNRPVENHALDMAKQSIFELIEREIFSKYSPEIQRILVKLSLFENVSTEVIKDLSNANINLIDEIEKTNMFIRFNTVTNNYRFHHLFLEFLSKKQFNLTTEERDEIHFKIAGWYHANGSEVDALEHYQKCEHYEEIWNIIRSYDISMPMDMCDLFLKLIESFPKEFAEKYPLIPVVHTRLLLNYGKIEECIEKFTNIMDKYEALPASADHKAILGETYLFMGIIRLLTCDYSFGQFFKKADESLPEGSKLIDNRMSFSEGNYMLLMKEAIPGELDKFINATTEFLPHAARAMNGCAYGVEFLTKASGAYFTGDMKAAESNAYKGIYRAEQKNQYDTVCAAYFTLIQVYISSGRYLKAADILAQLENKIEQSDPVYTKNCIYTFDILKGWYYARLEQMDKIPEWILKKEKREKVLYTYNLKIQLIRAYCLLKAENYYELSALLETLESYSDSSGLLLARLEVHIFKSIVAHKAHNISESITALRNAYDLAHANSIIMPFVELGKYMRTVIDNVKRDENNTIPEDWLDMIRSKATTYAKQLNNVRILYKESNGQNIKNQYRLSNREKEVLMLLCQGLTVREIGDSLYISSRTVKQVMDNTYSKLGAANKMEALRTAIQMGLDK